MIFLQGYILLALVSAIAFFLLVVCRNYSKPKPVYDKDVGLILPFFNDKRFLLSCLDTIAAQQLNDGIRLHVVLVNDRSTDGSGDIAKHWSEQKHKAINTITLIDRPVNFGKKAGPVVDGYRALDSIKSLKSDCVIVMDGDTLLSNNAVQSLVDRLYSNSKLGGVSGAIVINPSESKTWIQKLQVKEHLGVYPAIKTAMSTMGLMPVLSGALAIHRMEAIKDVGVWKTDWLVEDICWTWLAILKGWKMDYEPSALGWTEAPSTYKRLGNQRRRWTRGSVEALKECYHLGGKQLTAIMGFAYVILGVFLPLATIAAFHYQHVLSLWVMFISLVLTYAAVAWCTFKSKVFGSASESPKNLFLGSILSVIVKPYNIIGLVEELLGREKKWMTR